MTQDILSPRPMSRIRELRLAAPRRPSWRRILLVAAVVVGLLALSTIVSTLAHLRVPEATGSFGIGKASVVLVDDSRIEAATGDASDPRRVRIVAWYPAVAGTGEPAAYVEHLDAIGDRLVASESIDAFARSGLGFVTDAARADAQVADDEVTYPVIVLSPGNATNVEFYASLAGDLASHGYVVVGIDHPYQVGAVLLDDGEVAVYAGDPPLSQAAEVIPARIDERVADIGFVLDRLAQDAAGLIQLVGRLDLDRVGIVGHSNGGIAAAQACADMRIDACMNIDGQQAGGPFSSRPDPSAPDKPFLYLTKETQLHPALAALFEEGGRGTFRVVVPAAAHDEFTDGPMFRPRLLPTAVTADDVIGVTRGFSVAFFDHVLRGEPRTAFARVDARTDVLVSVYPLERPGP